MIENIQKIVDSDDFTIHAVRDGFDDMRMMDMHTHGLEKLIGTELQQVLFTGMEYLEERQMLLLMVADLLDDKKISVDSTEPFEIPGWDDCHFKLFKTKDYYGKDIVRIIECDMNGRFPENEGCAEPFSKQYTEKYGSGDKKGKGKGIFKRR